MPSEKGVRLAELASSLLHGSDLEKLSQLSSEEATEVFHGAPLKQLILEPGMSFLDVGRKAGCFASDSEYIF